MKLAYSVAQAAELCNISERQMRRLIAQGKIHAADMGDLRIGVCEIERYLSGVPRVAVSTAPETVSTPEPFPVRRSPSRTVSLKEKANV